MADLPNLDGAREALAATEAFHKACPHIAKGQVWSYVSDALAAVDILTAERDQLLAVLEDMVRHHVGTARKLDPTLDSCYDSTHADALRALAKHGRMTIVYDDEGRQVEATWVAAKATP